MRRPGAIDSGRAGQYGPAPSQPFSNVRAKIARARIQFVMTVPETHETRLKRLKFRSWHRGFKEADLILGPFADAHAVAMTGAELDAFERLLGEADQDIYDWVCGRSDPPAEFNTPVLRRIVDFTQRRRAP